MEVNVTDEYLYGCFNFLQNSTFVDVFCICGSFMSYSVLLLWHFLNEGIFTEIQYVLIFQGVDHLQIKSETSPIVDPTCV